MPVVAPTSGRVCPSRRALGATTSDVMRLVIANAARVIVVGGAIGLVLAGSSGRLIQSMLFGVRLDLTTFVLVAIVVGILAALRLPARPGASPTSTRRSR